MVHIRFVSLITCFSVLILAGCSTPGTSTGARVEDRSRPLEQDEIPGEETAPPRTYPETAEPPPEKTPLPPPQTRTDSTARGKQTETHKRPPSGAAVVALLDDAETYSGRGDNQQAIASLERALRIEPKNPVLWHKLSLQHLQQGNHVQAIAMAKKSNVLASGDAVLQGRNWEIIARARKGLGDDAGSQEAQRKADNLLQ